MTKPPTKQSRHATAHRRLTRPLTQDRYIADECLAAKERLQCTYPVTNGIVTEWDDMVAIWQHAFTSSLGIDPTDCNVLLTDPPLNPTANRTRMLEIMFEHFGFQGAFIQIQAVLTLYSQGAVLRPAIIDLPSC